jgi:hypothetical protein
VHATCKKSQETHNPYPCFIGMFQRALTQQHFDQVHGRLKPSARLPPSMHRAFLSPILASQRSSKTRTGSLHWQQMELREIDGQGLHVRTILHRSLHLGRELSPIHRVSKQDNKLLPGFCSATINRSSGRSMTRARALSPLPRRQIQVCLAMRTSLGTMRHHRIGYGHLHEGLSLMSHLSPRWLFALLTAGMSLTPQTIGGWRFVAVMAILVSAVPAVL